MNRDMGIDFWWITGIRYLGNQSSDDHMIFHAPNHEGDGVHISMTGQVQVQAKSIDNKPAEHHHTHPTQLAEGGVSGDDPRRARRGVL